MDSNMPVDFNYFNSAPVPYPFFASGAESQTLSPDEPYEHTQVSNDHFDPTGVAFSQSFGYGTTQYLVQTQPVNSVSGPNSIHPRHQSLVSETGSLHDALTNQEMGPTESGGLMRSSSEEKDYSTPQQNKRKAQNRAAQRAFRERKEKHLKELEARNTDLQFELINHRKEVDRLQKELAQANAQRNILQATSGGNSNQPTYFLLQDQEDIEPISVVHGYIPNDFPPAYSPSHDGDANAKTPFGSVKQLPADDEEDKLLDSGHTWDYIQKSELNIRGLVDVGDVCERLKNLARCDGKGPVFSERDIRRAIRESAVAGGRDELI